MEVFYLISDRMLGKTLDGVDYLYKDGQWRKDTEYLIADHRVGYDPSEPPDSPYGFGNGDIMSEMRQIDKEEAERLMREGT